MLEYDYRDSAREGDSVLFVRYTGGGGILSSWTKKSGGNCPGGGGGAGDFVLHSYIVNSYRMKWTSQTYLIYNLMHFAVWYGNCIFTENLYYLTP